MAARLASSECAGFTTFATKMLTLRCTLAWCSNLSMMRLARSEKEVISMEQNAELAIEMPWWAELGQSTWRMAMAVFR